ncbi:MAG TPA: PIN domain-containing protein [Steroidobacteraceae bacterium]|nr:PIN domain-containing protein [Steroidobacteraceae bacterium]
MILVDTGPLVALFDPRDGMHPRATGTLKSLREPLSTTVAVLTEAFHMLEPHSVGSDRLREFVMQGGLAVWFLDQAALVRAFELMERYADRPMDLADATLICAAEALRIRRIFTLDAADFATYRIRWGHRHHAVEVIG